MNDRVFSFSQDDLFNIFVFFHSPSFIGKCLAKITFLCPMFLWFYFILFYFYFYFVFLIFFSLLFLYKIDRWQFVNQNPFIYSDIICRMILNHHWAFNTISNIICLRFCLILILSIGTKLQNTIIFTYIFFLIWNAFVYIKKFVYFTKKKKKNYTYELKYFVMFLCFM